MADFTTLCEEGNLTEVKACLRRGQDVNIQNSGGMTGLMCAVLFGHTSVVQLLLTVENCQVNCQNRGGRTALHWACDHKNTVIMTSLLAHPDMWSVNTPDSSGLSPVMYAVMSGNVESVRVLVSDERLDLGTMDKQGRGLEERARWVVTMQGTRWIWLGKLCLDSG